MNEWMRGVTMTLAPGYWQPASVAAQQCSGPVSHLIGVSWLARHCPLACLSGQCPFINLDAMTATCCNVWLLFDVYYRIYWAILPDYSSYRMWLVITFAHWPDPEASSPYFSTVWTEFWTPHHHIHQMGYFWPWQYVLSCRYYPKNPKINYPWFFKMASYSYLKLSGQFCPLIFKWHLSCCSNLNCVGATRFSLSGSYMGNYLPI